MRSSIVLSLALAAAAAPAIAAPVSYSPPVARRQASSSTTTTGPTTGSLTTDDSGAFGWTSLIGPAISVIGSLFGNHNKREVEEFLARAVQENVARELMARADGDDSGAFGWTSLIGPAISVIGSLFGNHNKRELEELLSRSMNEEFARELMARADTAALDESGAFGWTSLIGPAISLFGSLFHGNNKREFEELLTRELMARADEGDSGAFGWTSLIGPAISLFGSLFHGNNKREFEELLTRALHEDFAREVMARAEADDSGAFGWTSLIGPAISLFGSLFHGNNKREFEELFTRALHEEFARELMARSDAGELDESGAFGWTSLIGPAISLVGSLFGNHNKRELEEILARGLMGQPEVAARSLFDLD